MPPKPHISHIAAARTWWAVSKLWFSGEERVKARAYAAAATFISILTTILLLKVSDVQSSLNSALSEKEPDAFYRSVWSFVGIIVVAAPLFAVNQYVDALISVEWRSWMARHMITAYMRDRAYFRLKIMNPRNNGAAIVDNPDQRITDDVRSFTGSSVVLAVGVLRQLFYCVAFGGLLASLAPGLVFFLFAYALLGTAVTAAGFGQRLATLAFSVLQKEADLRFDLVRVRESAESVAFYGADRREAATAVSRLNEAVAVSKQQIVVEAWLSLWQNAYGYATILLPSLLMAPRFFSGEIRFGTIVQVSYAFNRIEAALSFVVSNLSALSNLAAETERLDVLLTALKGTVESSAGGGGKTLENQEGVIVHRDNQENTYGGGGLEIENLTLTTPGCERVLCRGLSIRLDPGQTLLVVGPSGAGKSSLLRAIAGLWTSGSGCLRTPSSKDIFFLPQKPYMPLGTLRQQLLFPDLEVSTSDAQLTALLDECRLEGLSQRLGGLDAECDWASILSLGEQQRIAFLRLLRRRPTVAFIDEGTSGVDPATEASLYSSLKACCPCFVSVGHRKELVAHHTHVLEAVGEEGKWVFRTAPEYLALRR